MSHLRFPRRRFVHPLPLLAGFACVVATAYAQTAPAAAELARYDRNHNGRLDPDELAAQRADQAKAAAAITASASSSNGGSDVVSLSPFTVSGERETGYFAENTLAGTRLNTNIADLAASITVVTKQQLEDTSSVDINDVFMYEANTEGANTYTPQYLNRGSIRDAIGGYSGDDGTPFGIATANRVRGLGSADTAQNNYPTISRLQFDSYNTNTVEINRGPNSMLFGTGSPSGIVNQSTSEAVLNQRKSRASVRFGSDGAYRAALATNQPLGSKAAVYLAGLYDARGFPRKPSYDVYRRYYAALTLRPFSKTKITASYEHYDNRNNRPNYGAPLDYISPWLQAGRPGYDPITAMMTITNTGQKLGPYVTSNRDPRWAGGPTGNNALTTTSSALYIPGIAFSGHNQMWIDSGSLVGFWINTPSQIAQDRPATSALTASQWVAYAARPTSSIGFLAPTPPASSGATGYGSWYDVGVTNRSLYDWTSYNIQSANYGTQYARTFNLELQQQILPNLNFAAGWFRQELTEFDHYPLGQANQAVRLYVDTNTRRIDGTPNPYFGSPYVYDYQADTFYRPEKNDNLRAMLAYELNFAKQPGWTRFLGRHRLLGLGTRQRTWSNNLRLRNGYDAGDARMLPNQNTNPPNNFSWAANASNLERHYYLGKNNAGLVQHGAGFWGEAGFGGPDTAPLHIYNWATNRWEVSQMHFQPQLFYAGANYGVTTKQIDSRSLGWQAYLWDNRLIPTLGWRNDRLRIRSYDPTGLTTPMLYTDGYGNPDIWNRLGSPFDVQGSTTTRGVVAKPFLGWRTLDRKAETGSVLADFVRGLSFHYNESDNFNAPTSIQTDFFGNTLGKPSGTGKDYGFGGSLFNNKLNFRVNWYESSNKNAPANAAGTAIGRTERVDYTSTLAWARYVVRIRHGQDPTAPGFDDLTQHPISSAMQGEIEKLYGLPYQWPETNIQGTESNKSKGMEFSLIANPTRNWTLKLTAGKQESFYSDAVGELQRWLAVRKPFWEKLSAPDMPAGEIIMDNGRRLSLRKFWDGYGFSADARIENTNGWVSPHGFYSSVVEPQIYSVTSLQNTAAPNERKWSYSVITNYGFSEGRLKGLALGGSLRWQDKAVAGYYGLLDPNRYSHPTATRSLVVFPDLNRPIYTPAETHVDLWVSYTTRLPKFFGDGIRAKFQFNVRDATEHGGLQAILFEPDGSPAQYRIRDPRQYFFTATFDL